MRDIDELEFEEENEFQEEKKSWLKRNLTSIFLIFFAFFLGILIMGWQYWKSTAEVKTVRNELIETSKSLQKEKIKVLLMNAVIESNREEYDLALVDTSRFFKSLKSEIEKNEDSAYFTEEKVRLRKTFVNRDMTIASLARRENESVDNLIGIYLTYLKSIGEYRKSGIKKEKKAKIESNTNTNTEKPVNKNQNIQNSEVNKTIENTNTGNQKSGNSNVQNMNISNINTNQTQ